MLKLSCQNIDRKEFLKLAANVQPDRAALLLAGGDGARLQELTREITGVPIPKQYCRLWHGSSLLEATLSRAHLFAPSDRISVIVNKNHLDLAREQLSSLPESNILVQPLNRDTGPGMLFSLSNLAKKHPEAIVATFPTDHFIDDNHAFVAHVFRAVDTIHHMPDKIAILGIAPDHPATGYGYVLPATPLTASEKAYHVKTFTEKPSLSNAQTIISNGGLWNTFVLVFKISRMLELVREIVPHHFERFSRLQEFPHKSDELYRELDAWNFSTEVLSQISEHLILFEIADVHWSDWGTRESVERTYKNLNMVPSWIRPDPTPDSLAGS
jgi:mannose-1-phosphate guanylyltransferase